MKKSLFAIKALVAAALLAGAGIASATVESYSSADSFSAAVEGQSSALDDFSTLATGNLTKSITRGEGLFTYTATATGGKNTLWGNVVDGNVALSTNKANRGILLNGFEGIVGVGADMYPSDQGGLPIVSKLRIIVTELDGDVYRFKFTEGGYMGFVSDDGIASLKVSTSFRAEPPAWPTIDNLTLASTVPVPEPETYALMLAGLAAIGFVARRRKAL